MRFAPYAGPSKAELDRVKRVLFPADEEEEEEEKEEVNASNDSGSSAPPEKKIMSAGGKIKSRRKTEGTGGIAMQNVFQLDPNVEVFNAQSTVKARRAKRYLSSSYSSALPTVKEDACSRESGAESQGQDDDAHLDPPCTKSVAASSNDGISEADALSGVSPARRRFDPPFKTPPSSSSTPTSNDVVTQGEKTPPYKTPPRSPTTSTPGDKEKVDREMEEEKNPDSLASMRERCPEEKSSSSPSQEIATTTPSGKRKLFTNTKVPVDQLPSPTKKAPRSKFPKMQLKMRPVNSKSPPPKKKEKPDTAKDRAAKYRVANRGKILQEMEKHKSDIGSLLERRKQRKNQQDSQDGPSPERAEKS